MDKQKQIEEMEKDVCKNVSTKMCADGTCPNTWDCPFNYKTVEALYNAGYRKITDEVVLTREEYDELDKCRWNNKKVADILLRFEEVEGKIRKETAEKFAKRLKAEAHYTVCDTRCVSVSRIDEICKDIVEGKKDGT